MKPKKQSDLIAETPVTYETYASLPDDGNRYEVAGGRLELMSPAPSPTHQSVSYELHALLKSGCRQDYFIFSAPIDVVLSETEVRQPDVVMIHRSRQSQITKRGIFGSPDLVAEITSEHSRRRDKVHKTKVYAKYGVPEYWIVDLTNFTLEQYVLRESGMYELIEVYAEDEPVRSERLACVSFSMADLTRDLPPEWLE